MLFSWKWYDCSFFPSLSRTMESKFMDHNRKMHWKMTSESVNDHLHPLAMPLRSPDFNTQRLASCPPSMLIEDGPEQKDKTEEQLSSFLVDWLFFGLVNCPGVRQGSPNTLSSGGKWEARTILYCQRSDCSLLVNKDCVHVFFFPADAVYMWLYECVSPLISVQRNTVGTVPHGWNSLEIHVYLT